MPRRPSAASWPWISRSPRILAGFQRARDGSTSIRLGDVHSGIVVPDDLIVGRTGLRHAVGPHLAQADAVAPALAGEDEASDAALGVALPVHDEQVLAQPERPADLQPLE